ncbi:hypothetical protein [Enterovibrio calviensis]|uniref:hypothetical protein n=1 Tax=Enterovibrio calviensis TaxID=91359 RepID=UPI000487ABF7|nr:hypothetical protein [Enterovibrio calviensis]
MAKNNNIPCDYLVKRQRVMGDLTDHLNKFIQENQNFHWHYKEFGKQVEQPIINFLVNNGLLSKDEFKDQSDNKNEVPDVIDQQYLLPIFIDIKAGNTVAFSTGKKITNPNQDLSTTVKWRDEIFNKFDGELCYFIEIKYNHSKGNNLYVEECHIDHFYNFVGKTQAGLISHRNRNVRTKSWNSESQFKDSEEFKGLLDKTISFAVKNALFNGSKNLTEDDKIEIIEHLKGK